MCILCVYRILHLSLAHAQFTAVHVLNFDPGTCVGKMHVSAKEAFHKALQQLKLSSSSTVGEGLENASTDVIPAVLWSMQLLVCLEGQTASRSLTSRGRPSGES